jgi:hypothetical protein
MTGIRLVGLFVMAVLWAGCASLTSPAREHVLDEGKTYWFDYEATRRGAILVPRHEKKNVVICAEPSPDVALSIVDKFRADVGTGKVTVGGEADVEQQAIQLAGRTQTLMVLRESLYRLCELSLNFDLEDEDVVALYKNVTDAVFKMAGAAELSAQQAKLDAERRLIETMKETPGLIDAYKERLKKNP